MTETTDEQERFLEGEGVEDALHGLHDAITASVQARGGKGIKAFSVIVITDLGTGVANEGCDCPACQIAAIQAFAESHGAEWSLKEMNAPDHPDHKGLH